MSAHDPADADVVLAVRGLRKSFGKMPVLDNINADLHRGDVVLLQGENGSGKTTLVNLLTGILYPDSGSITISTTTRPETIRFPVSFLDNVNPIQHFGPERMASKGLGRTWQELRLFRNMDAVDNLRVAAPNKKGESIKSALWPSTKARAESIATTERSRSMLQRLGLSSVSTHAAATLSLGEARRVILARALASGSEILILDEPLSGLDLKGVREILDLLKLLLRERTLTLIIVEHVLNLAFVLDVATKVWTLAEGQLREDSVADVSRDLVSWRSRFNEHHAPTSHFSNSTSNRVQTLCRGGRLITFKSKAVTNSRSEVILSAQNLIVNRFGQILFGATEESPLCVELERGCLHVLEAPNGWGKTTLLDIFAGAVRPNAGTIHYEGHPLGGLVPWERRRLGVAYLPSNNGLFSSLTDREHQRLFKVKNSASKHRRVSEFSGGQQKWFAFSCITQAPNVKLLLLDEPLNELDHEHALAAWCTIRDFVERGGTVLVAVPRTLDAWNYD